jgi:hypothetical protein
MLLQHHHVDIGHCSSPALSLELGAWSLSQVQMRCRKSQIRLGPGLRLGLGVRRGEKEKGG